MYSYIYLLIMIVKFSKKNHTIKKQIIQINT